MVRAARRTIAADRQSAWNRYLAFGSQRAQSFLSYYSVGGPDVVRKHPADRLSVARRYLCYHAPAERKLPRPQRIGRLGGTSLHGHESERMGIISELRHPTTWYTKLTIAILALAIFALLVAGSVSGYLVYRMVLRARSHSEIDLQNFPGHPQPLNFTVNGEGPRDGWFFPGLKSAPTIVLCPAYESSRGELLTLGSALQYQQYNVFLFDFSAH